MTHLCTILLFYLIMLYLKRKQERWMKTGWRDTITEDIRLFRVGIKTAALEILELRPNHWNTSSEYVQAHTHTHAYAHLAKNKHERGNGRCRWWSSEVSGQSISSSVFCCEIPLNPTPAFSFRGSECAGRACVFCKYLVSPLHHLPSREGSWPSLTCKRLNRREGKEEDVILDSSTDRDRKPKGIVPVFQ